jgi:hypothetical protein
MVYEVISARDESFDWDKLARNREVFRDFCETRDPALIQSYLLPGAQPVVFRLREISHEWMRGWVALANSPGRPGGEDEQGGATPTTYFRAFQCAVMSVMNMTSEDGVVMAEWEPPKFKDGFFQGAILDEALERFSFPEIMDVGALAYQKSGFRRGTRPIWRLPRMFLDLLSPPPRRSAAASSTSPQQPSATQSGDGAAASVTPDSIDRPRRSGDERSDSRTDASAPVPLASAGG